MPPAPEIGDVVGGKYRLSRLLGEGGMGIVFEAEHLRLMQRVAIKWLRPDVLAMPDALERFDREARAICRMRGPHVAHVMDVDADGFGRPYMVMELLQGRDLEVELQTRGALPISEAVDWTLQACAAIAEAHKAGIVHRDLKPSNLFLAEEAGARVVKVLDFGISKLARDEPSVTTATVTLGTPLYMSPEQVRSSKDVDGRADIWSLGVILYELVTGSPPFLGTTTAAIAAIVADATPRPREVRPEVPEGLELAIMTALAKSPDDRFPTAEAFAAALMPFASAEGIAGPFSLRPSQEAFEIASSAMARVPAGAYASDASDLLKLPTSRTTKRRVVPRPEPRWSATRTFLGTVTIGFAVAAGAVLGMQHTPAEPHDDVRPSPANRGAQLDSARAERSGLGSVQGADTHAVPRPAEELVDATPERSAALTRPRPAAPPGPSSTSRATTASPPAQRGRNVPAHAIDRPLYL
jgi:serine/threonine-protein kinase